MLGNEVLASGKPSARLQARLDCALALYRSHMTKRIMVSGGIGKSGFDEAGVMADYLVTKGVPRQNVITDSLGVNTQATALHAARIVKTEGLRNVIAVTQYYHIPRTVFAFHRAGIASVSAAYPRYAEWFDLLALLRETAALPVYFIKMPSKE